MKGYQTMSATERRDKNAKIKKLGNRVRLYVVHSTVHHHTRTRVEQDVSLKAWVIKNLLFRFSYLSNPSPIFRSYSRPSMQEAVELRKGPQFDYPGS